MKKTLLSIGAFAVLFAMASCSKSPADEAIEVLEKECECDKLFDNGQEEAGWKCLGELDEMADKVNEKYKNNPDAMKEMREAAAKFKCK